jgi:hypothetical protein
VKSGTSTAGTSADFYGENHAVSARLMPRKKPLHSTRKKMDHRLDARRPGRLKNGNPSGPQSGPGWPGLLCGAKTRAEGECRNPAMRNGRCRMHGRASTGPRTPEGKSRAAMARWKHGLRSRRGSTIAEICRLVRRRSWLPKRLMGYRSYQNRNAESKGDATGGSRTLA